MSLNESKRTPSSTKKPPPTQMEREPSNPLHILHLNYQPMLRFEFKRALIQPINRSSL